MNLAAEFLELLAQFNSFGVKYAIVGGYALAYHGHPRATKDIDVFVDNSPENIQRLSKALECFGFSSGELSQEALRDPRLVIRFGAPPNMVDILKTIDGVNFEEVYCSAVRLLVSDVQVQIISREMLVKNKAASGRYQDLADLEALGEIKGRK